LKKVSTGGIEPSPGHRHVSEGPAWDGYIEPVQHDDEQPVVREIGNRTYIVADVDPLDLDGVRTMQVGTALWLAGLIVLLPFHAQLREDGHLWWLWTCVAGFGLGLVGWDHCRRRRRLRSQGRLRGESS
jgi:hypothetical protein